jgi:hypothetical protein
MVKKKATPRKKNPNTRTDSNGHIGNFQSPVAAFCEE